MSVLHVPFVIKGELVTDGDVEHGRLRTPPLRLDDLVWSRRQPGPAFDISLDEVIDLLEETGKRLDPDTNEWLAQAMARAGETGTLTRRLLEYSYRTLPELFSRRSLEFQLESEIGLDASSGWSRVQDAWGHCHAVRAFPPRLAHIVAGNTPGTAAITIARGALTRGLNLMKLGADDPLTASAILRTMNEIAPGHPTVRSFTAVYWKGGDRSIESAVFRPQYFDKLVAWGGEAAIRNALSYVGPGLELVAFDPKVSISLLGREGYASEAAAAESADGAAADVGLYNQAACASSRFIYAEGSMDELGPWCTMLAERLGIDRPLTDGRGVPVPDDIVEAVEGLRYLAPDFQVFGDFDTGVVVLSEDPVDFHPEGKVVNVVAVPELEDALNYVTVATQTIGIYPAERGEAMRDALASAGMQRLVGLGGVAGKAPGLPHDGFYPLQRLVRWLVDDASAGQ